MISLKDAALQYAKDGWIIFPTKTDKTPYTTHGVTDATTNLEQIEEWWTKWPKANIALDVGSMNMMVLDMDPGHSLEELESNVGPIPRTGLRARTPREGEHLYFGLGEGEIVSPSASKLAPHVDVRSFHSYVLLPPSKTKDGDYSWVEKDKPHFRTDEMLRSSNAGRDKHEDRDNWIIEADQQHHIDEAIKWCREEAKIGIVGQGGDHTTYATAAMMKSFGLSEGTAFEILWEHWCPRCSPPWDEGGVDELERKISNAYTYNTSPPGNLTQQYKVASTAALFSPVKTDLGDKGGEWQAGRFRFVDEEGLENLHPPEWIVQDFLPEKSYAIMFGEPGTFKTFLALDIALTVAAGFGLGDATPWGQGKITYGNALFVAGEGRASIGNRVKAWKQTHVVNCPNKKQFVLADPVPLVKESIDPFIEGALAVSPNGYRLVVLDTVGRAMQGLNENSQEHASAFTNTVEHIQHRLGATVLALHHTGFSDQHRARGSSVFGADADTIIRLDRKGKQNIVSLTMTKQKDAQEWKKPKHVKLDEIHLDLKTKTLVAVQPSEAENPKIKEKEKAEAKHIIFDIIEEIALDILESHPGKGYSQRELASVVARDKRTDIGNQQIEKKYLTSLREDNNRAIWRCYLPDNKATEKWMWQV